MSHEKPHVASRSASHAALNRSYVLPTRASSAILDAGHHLVPYFKPLRSIREHGHTFLDPAASADGMLRKTTETGNIGLFSISPGRRNALRPRASLGDLRQPHRPFSRASDRPAGHDDRKRLPSYRDSTSEIISMYGSDNQSSAKSVSGTLSPPWEDLGQRSYSMTTCGSKSYTLPHETGLQQAHDINSGIQRPRSPYPYPTRLPRPGIRPSSPALTENGKVDYSRMVEIDRIPKRTVHHPYKPLFPYKTTRDQPSPLSIRYGINQSTRSLSDDCDPTHPFSHPASRRPPLHNHLHPWGLRPRDRLRSESSNQSMRSASLNSTSGGYVCAPVQMSSLPGFEKKPPIFYDYSEDFEDAVEPPPDFSIASPTPTRVSNSFHPGLSEDECDTGSESADEGVVRVVEYLRRVTMIDSGENQDKHQNREKQDIQDEHYDLEHYRPVSQLCQSDQYRVPFIQGLASSPTLLRLAQTVDSSSLSNATLSDHQDSIGQHRPEGLCHLQESILNGFVSEESTIESPLGPDTPAHDVKLPLTDGTRYDDEDDADSSVSNERSLQTVLNTNEQLKEVFGSHMALSKPVSTMISRPVLADSMRATSPYRYCSERRDSRFCSISSGLFDLASFVKCVDKHMQTFDGETEEQDDSPIPGSKSEPASSHQLHRCQYKNTPDTPGPPRKSSLANQGRSRGGLHVNFPMTVDELDRFQMISTRSGPTLVPQPISPAKILRLKNNIPQLMKALPPLPSYSPASESPFNPTLVPVEFEPFDFSGLTDAHSTLIEDLESQSHGEETHEFYGPFAFDRAVRKPRLKLKAHASRPLDHACRTRPRHHGKGDGVPPEDTGKVLSTSASYSTVPINRRLPVKVSRSALGLQAADDTGTVKRQSGADRSKAVSELASLQPIDLFSSSIALEKAVQNTVPFAREQSTASEKECGPLTAFKTTHVARIQRVTVNEDGRGASLDTHLDTFHTPRLRAETTTEDGMQSSFSDSLVKPQRGLRKKLSNLKSRLTESRHHHYHPPMVKVDTTATRSQSPLAIGYPLKGSHPVRPTRTVRSKWEKLLKEAKHKLRIWGKSRHKNG